MPKANTYFHTSRGEYSDYRIGEHYKVLKNFNFVEQCKVWIIMENIDANKVIFKKDISWGNKIKSAFRFINDFNDNDLNEKIFFEWLIKMKFIIRLEFEEYHTGSYDDFELKDEYCE